MFRCLGGLKIWGFKGLGGWGGLGFRNVGVGSPGLLPPLKTFLITLDSLHLLLRRGKFRIVQVGLPKEVVGLTGGGGGGGRRSLGFCYPKTYLEFHGYLWERGFRFVGKTATQSFMQGSHKNVRNSSCKSPWLVSKLTVVFFTRRHHKRGRAPAKPMSTGHIFRTCTS